MSHWFLPFIGGVLIAFGLAGLFTVDRDTGRITHTPRQAYTLASGALSADHIIELGDVEIPSGKQVNAVWLTGRMKANDRAQMFGVVFDLYNDATVGDAAIDPTRVRAIIGQVTTTGAGSVRGVHATAMGAPGSTGAINALNGEVHPAQTTQRAYAIGAMQTGVGGIADGIFFGSREPFRFGANLAEMATYSQAAIYLGVGREQGILWSNGIRLYVDARTGLLMVEYPQRPPQVIGDFN